jgi:hypothetical protein
MYGSFLKAECKVSDTGSAHQAFSFNSKHFYGCLIFNKKNSGSIRAL